MSNEGTTLGDFLRAEREKRGITIEQVASATKIGVRVLHALEADHYSELPAKPFVRGFVISYCRFIGLSHKEVLTQFDGFLAERCSDRPVRDEGHKGYAFDRSEEGQNRTLLWVAMGATLVVGAVFMVLVKPSLHRRRSAHVEKLRAGRGEPSPIPSALAEVAPLPSPEPSVAPSPSPSPSTKVKVKPSPSPNPSPSASASPVPDPLQSGRDTPRAEVKQRIEFKTLADIWIRYQVDDKPMQRIKMRAGRQLFLYAREKIKFQVSNPKSVLINPNRKGYTLVEESPTRVYPPELGENMEEPFPSEPPLPETAAPLPEGSAPLSTPAP